MIGRGGALLLAVALAATAHPARADENGDLARIPGAANAAPAEEPQVDTNRQLYLQNDLILNGVRGDLLVPFPPPKPANWEERLFFDARARWALSDKLSFVLSDRFNFRGEDGLDFPSHENIRNDLREAYLAWDVDGETFVDIGRVNLKSGVALGFNPTDYFKTRAVVEPLSADPSVLREDRLGTLMITGQRIWEGGAVTVAFAPKVTNPSPVYTNLDLPSFNPMFDRTNAKNRALIKTSFTLADDLSPEILLYAEDGSVQIGANLTRGFGQYVVGYVEWSGGNSASLVHQALAYGRETGTIPAAAPPPFPESSARGFQNALALGASYTTESKITFNLEYHYYQPGFSNSDWQNWFRAGSLGIAPIDAELWYIRGFAAEQQVPVARHTAFLRMDWQDAFVPDLEITAFVNDDMRDGSGLVQATADYAVSRAWTIGVLGDLAFGGRRSDFGSLPGESTLLFKVTRYF